jgi:Raf kinase inhibitor-like YbhB/YbcL family protein
MELTSVEFGDGGPIPRRYGYEEENVNPPLVVEGVPKDAESLALVVDDPDAVEPAGKVWDHWTVWNIPPETTSIPEAWDPTKAGAREGRNDYDEIGYGGPNPPDREHTYRFVLYALDTDFDLRPGAPKEELEETIAGHVVGEAHLRGTYHP